MKKIVSTNARVISKTQNQERNIIVFVADNRAYEFYVDIYDYNKIRVGQKGTLKFKGGQFISFK